MTVEAPPAGQTCLVTAGTGALAGAAFTGVAVTCSKAVLTCDPSADRVAPATRVAAGQRHTLFVDDDGQLWAWGDNGYGQLGLGFTGGVLAAPVQVGLADVVEVAAGDYHGLALLADGTVRAFGRNDAHELGQPGDAPKLSNVPLAVPLLQDVVAIAAGARHSLALLVDGRVVAWGDNTQGQLGTGSQGPTGFPVEGEVPGLDGVVAIAAAGYRSFALRDDGTLYAWGDNGGKDLLAAGCGPCPDAPLPIEAAAATCVLRMAPRDDHNAFLRDDGALLGGLTLAPLSAPEAPVVAVAANDDAVFALTGDGVVHRFPSTSAQSSPIADLPPVSDVFAARDTFAALDADGHPWLAGANDKGQLGRGHMTGSAVHPVAPAARRTANQGVVSGSNTTAVLRADGSVWLFGKSIATPTSSWGLARVPELTDVKQVAVGASHLLALRHDGTVWVYGPNTKGLHGTGTTSTWTSGLPVQATSLAGVKVQAVAARQGYNLALDDAGEVWCWGDNGAGQCATGATSNAVTSATKIAGLTNVTAMSAGDFHALAVTGDGAVWGWGSGYYGRLAGLAPNQVQTSAAPLVDGGGQPITGVADVAAGDTVSFALTADGRVLGWGTADSGALASASLAGVVATPVEIAHPVEAGAPMTGVSAVVAAARGGAALVGDAVFAWGDVPGVDAAPSTPDGLPQVVALASGMVHMAALSPDGALWAWGDNGHGQLGADKGDGAVAQVLAWDAGLPGCASDADCADPQRPWCEVASGRCVACLTSGDCADPEAPICLDGAKRCVQCATTADCAGGQVCRADTHDCGPCVANADCPAAAPLCDVAAGACVACLGPADCAPGEVCRADTSTCGPCTADADCVAPGKPWCDAGACVACLDSAHCSGSSVCRDDGTCGGCTADAQCTKDPAKPLCRTSNGQCVTCLGDADCPPEAPGCYVSVGTCHECTSNGHCGGATPVCNTTARQCVTCQFDSHCTAQLGQSGLCVAGAQDGLGLCLAKCWTDGECGPDEACALPTNGTIGLCLPATCGGLGSADCGPKGTCISVGGQTECLYAGSQAEGGVCYTVNGCAPGLLCVEGTCVAPDCDPTVPCGPGGECVPYEMGGQVLDQGRCGTPCPAFAAPDPCPEGTFCEVAGKDAESGAFVALCQPSTDGWAAEGEYCYEGSCLDGLVCTPEGDWDSFCRAPCDPAAVAGAPGACGEDGQVCVAAPGQGLGVCRVGCVPFVSGQPCGADAWCLPDAQTAGLGQCVALTGDEAGVGEACGEPACCGQTCTDDAVRACACALDGYCCSGWDSLCVSQATIECGLACGAGAGCAQGLVCAGGACAVACATGATADDPGSCPAGQACAPVEPGAEPGPLGYCGATCTFEPGAAQGGCDPGAVCQMGELAGGVDQCVLAAGAVEGFPLEPMAQCPPGSTYGDVCAGGGVCFYYSGFQCSQACRTAVSPFGQAHPDCADALGTHCYDGLGRADLGVCLP